MKQDSHPAAKDKSPPEPGRALPLAQALITLGDLYDTVSARGQPSPCEAEFRAYALLTMIGTHGNFQYNTATFLNMLRVRSVQHLEP